MTTQRRECVRVITLGIVHLIAVIGILLKVIPVWDRLNPLVITALLGIFVLGTISSICHIACVFQLKEETKAE